MQEPPPIPTIGPVMGVSPPRRDPASRLLAEQDWEKTTALLMHLSLLTWHVLLPVVPALVLWLWRRKRSVCLDDHGREALNFQITLLFYAGVLGILGPVTCGTAWYVGLPPLYVFAIVAMILACRSARRGMPHRYPMTVRLIRPAL
jgi:uncharacterized protein